jgi:hypothetical protein
MRGEHDPLRLGQADPRAGFGDQGFRLARLLRVAVERNRCDAAPEPRGGKVAVGT